MNIQSETFTFFRPKKKAIDIQKFGSADRPNAF